ncbi:MAG: ferritin family protein [Planctomycetes bacterium]|nr:ferritin family protein [Planctomycetota bacterium]
MQEKVESVNEILEFAISREVEASQLYTYMAKRMIDPEMRNVCREFAKEELEHKAKLELELMKLGELVTDFDISNYVTGAGEPMEMDYEELLIFAMNKEEVSINLYHDLAEVVRTEQSRGVLLALAREEVEHRQRFEIEYRSLRA